MPIIPAAKRLREEDGPREAGLGMDVKASLEQTDKQTS